MPGVLRGIPATHAVSFLKLAIVSNDSKILFMLASSLAVTHSASLAYIAQNVQHAAPRGSQRFTPIIPSILLYLKCKMRLRWSEQVQE